MARKDVIINSVPYLGVPEVDIPLQGGGTAKFYEISDATITANGQMLSGYVAYGSDGTKYTGNIATKSSSDLTASGSLFVAPAGYYASDASKNVTDLDSNLKTENIKAGVTIFGISGATNVIDTTSATPITSAVVLNGYEGYVNGAKVTGNVATQSQLTVAGATVTAPAGYYASDVSATIPSGSATTPAKNIDVSVVPTLSNATGKITIAVSGQSSITPTVTSGYITAGTAGTIHASGSGELQLTTKAAQTYTPGTANITIASNQWLTGVQTISGDADLIPANIKSGINIFGVPGSSKVVDTTDATAASGDILSGKTAYVNGSKVTGTIANLSAANLTASGSTITVASGYYSASAVSKSISAGSATTPAKTITATATPSLNSSTGVVSVSVSGSSSITPTVSAGYVSSGTAGTVTVTGSSSLQLATLSAQTYTPGTQDITIAAGKYLTGAQTIQGDSNLQSGYIVSGKSIFGVNGTLSLPTITQDTTTKVLTIA